MSIELKEAAQQVLKELGEARKIVRASSSRQLAKDWDRRATDALANLREAIQQAETQHPIKTQQPVTAIACGIPGMAKTTCPYCEQGFAFEHEQPANGEPVGYMNEGHIHELAMRRIPYGYVYPEAGAGASTAVYAHTAPSVPATPDPVKAERDQLRCAQADAVIPLIGPLLDAWENSDREVMSQEPELSKQLKNINSAMEDADTHPAPSVPGDVARDAGRWRTFLATRPSNTHEVVNAAIDAAMLAAKDSK